MGSLEIDWDDPENYELVKENVRLLLKAGGNCGPGCRCSNCCNVPNSNQVPSEPDTGDEQERVGLGDGIYNIDDSDDNQVILHDSDMEDVSQLIDYLSD